MTKPTKPEDIDLKELESYYFYRHISPTIIIKFKQFLSDKLNRIEKQKRCISSVAFHICSKHPEDCEYVVDEEIILKEFIK